MNSAYKIFVVGLFSIMSGLPLVAAADQAVACQKFEAKAQCNVKKLKNQGKINRAKNCQVHQRSFKVRCATKNICGQPPFFCPRGVLCAEVMPQPRTYEDLNTLKAAGATLLYYGACRSVDEVRIF